MRVNLTNDNRENVIVCELLHIVLYLVFSIFILNITFWSFTNTQNCQYWHYSHICILRYLQFSSLIETYDASKYEINYQ